MNLTEIKINKLDERGIIYDCDKVKFISRKKGTISANHMHNVPETFYLVSGEIELTIGDKKNASGLKELTRLREIMADFFFFDNIYKSTAESWQKYFYAFNYAARKNT